MENTNIRNLVKPGCMNDCVVRWEEFSATVLDISFVRVVLKEVEEWPTLVEHQILPISFSLNGFDFVADLKIQGRGEGWTRFHFERLVPSGKSMLRSFLSPKKVGESLFEDSRATGVRHFHGLNESELWFDAQGNVLFTYLDHLDAKYQFLVQANLQIGSVKVGRLSRAHYMNMDSLSGELGLLPLNDRENYTRMSECRDIVTNFRPVGQTEYNLKQKLLKLVSESLYSTGHRVDFPMVRAVRLPYLSTEH
jgi:hypothetical protein